MEKIKLTSEQKAYLQSIDSKKKRKKLKKEFLCNNEIESVLSMVFQTPKYKYVIADGTNLHEVKLKADDSANTDKCVETKYGLKDLRKAFLMARYMKSVDTHINSDSRAEYYYDDFNHFLKDL